MRSSLVVPEISQHATDASKAKEELHWVAERGLDEMCEDSWRWQSRNPMDTRDNFQDYFS